MTDRKKWVQPELIVLLRQEPAEAVLEAFKMFNYVYPNKDQSGCQVFFGPPSCTDCSGVASS